MRYVLKSVVALLLSAALAAPGAAQTPSSGAKKPNVQTGRVAAINAEQNTLAMQPRTGAALTYKFNAKTHFWKRKRTAQATDFTVGDEVTVRFRKPKDDGPPTLYDCMDKASWDWQAKIRREPTAAAFQSRDDDFIHVTVAEGPETLPLEYRWTEKTQWFKAGAEAQPDSFHAGDTVWITPRLLPNGNVMAVGVADTKPGAAILKERSLPTVTGVVQRIETARKEITLKSQAGDTRTLPYTDQTTVRRSAKTVPFAALHPNLTITAHLKRSDADNKKYITAITIQTGTKKKK